MCKSIEPIQPVWLIKFRIKVNIDQQFLMILKIQNFYEKKNLDKKKNSY